MKLSEKWSFVFHSFQDDFIEKNRNITPHVLSSIIQRSTGLYEISNVKLTRTFKTSASTLKCEIDSLIEKLKKTVISLKKNHISRNIIECQHMNIFNYFQHVHFIRCIQPNNEKRKENFDDELVLKQLKTSSIISHAEFIRFGYSKRINVQSIVEACKPIEKRLTKLCANPSKLCSYVMLYLGFKLNEFKLGKDVIFCRSNKFHLLEQFLSSLNTSNLEEIGTTISFVNQSILKKPKLKPK